MLFCDIFDWDRVMSEVISRVISYDPAVDHFGS